MEPLIETLQNQYEAALSTMNRCVVSCSDEQWARPVAKLTYAQAAFHAIFFADLYLHPEYDESFREQDFHRQHRADFGDYEELEDRPQVNQYERPFLKSYVRHCVDKARRELARSDLNRLAEPSPFPWIQTTRGEVHVVTIRHLQHHAAQLILVLRQSGITDFPWYKTGWSDCETS